jgi:hypothetical protein
VNTVTCQPRQDRPGAQWEHMMRQAIDGTDVALDELHHRVTALEAVAATRWPRSVLARIRLARDLRASVRHIEPGGTFAARRAETLMSGWPPSGGVVRGWRA